MTKWWGVVKSQFWTPNPLKAYWTPNPLTAYWTASSCRIVPADANRFFYVDNPACHSGLWACTRSYKKAAVCFCPVNTSFSLNKKAEVDDDE